MRTSIFRLATLLSLGAAQTFAQATDEFVARETSVWQAVKDKRLDAFTAALDTSVVAVYADGIHTRAAEVASVRQANLRSFTLTEFATRHLDRKSTRLNSSHGYISYAVFCLKKKKTNRTTTHS